MARDLLFVTGELCTKCGTRLPLNYTVPLWQKRIGNPVHLCPCCKEPYIDPNVTEWEDNNTVQKFMYLFWLLPCRAIVLAFNLFILWGMILLGYCYFTGMKQAEGVKYLDHRYGVALSIAIFIYLFFKTLGIITISKLRTSKQKILKDE